jgi:hypothetical protein
VFLNPFIQDIWESNQASEEESLFSVRDVLPPAALSANLAAVPLSGLLLSCLQVRTIRTRAMAKVRISDKGME